MKWITRVSLEVLAPPFIAALFFLTPGFVTEPLRSMMKVVPTFFGVAYLFAIVPSIIYAIVMEVRFYRGAAQRSKRTVLFSSGIGSLCGLVIALFLSPDITEPVVYLFFGGLGAVVGCLIAGLLYLIPEVPRIDLSEERSQ